MGAPNEKFDSYKLDPAEALRRVIEARPQLATFLDSYGSLTLSEYGKIAISSQGTLSKAFQDILSKKISSYFDESAAKRLSDSMHVLCSVDTSGHGGILSEDTLVQSHAVLSEGVRENQQKCYLTLSCGVVPMNNSTWPRGMFIGGSRFSLIPKAFDRVAYHECPAISKDQLNKKLKDNATPQRARKILERALEIPNIFSLEKFYQQVTVLNHALWNEFIRADSQPELFQLMLEALTADLVVASIESDDALSRMIFCGQNFEAFFEFLSGLPGTWSSDRSKGTYLFWRASGDFRAASLWREGHELVGHGPGIGFDPESIVRELRSRSIVPSVFLSLITLLHHGVRPLGGYHQLWYLPEYKNRLEKASELIADLRCPEFLSHINCADLFQLGYGFAFLTDPQYPNAFAGLDAFAANPALKKALWDSMHKVSVRESILLNISRWFKEIVRM